MTTLLISLLILWLIFYILVIVKRIMIKFKKIKNYRYQNDDTGSYYDE